MTEEIFPGYRFTEFSYVVSLLRPEIIRDLELPRHGLKILPLPSTVTPMDNGDYLAAWDDHDLTRREIYRHSPNDAEAYDEYGRVMARAAKAIKPILGSGAARSVVAAAARPAGPAQARPVREEPERERTLPDRQARHAILGRSARRVVRVRPAERHQVRQRHHRHVPGPAFAGHGVCAAASLHGRDRRRVPRLGLRQERHRRRHGGDRAARRARSAWRSARARRCSRSSSRAAAPRASRWRTATSCSAKVVHVGGRPEAQLPAVRRRASISPTNSSQQIQNFRVRGSSGKVNIALSELPRVHLPARRKPAASRRDLDQPEHRLHRARLRRSQVRPVLEEPRIST